MFQDCLHFAEAGERGKTSVSDTTTTTTAISLSELNFQLIDYEQLIPIRNSKTH